MVWAKGSKVGIAELTADAEEDAVVVAIASVEGKALIKVKSPTMIFSRPRTGRPRMFLAKVGGKLKKRVRRVEQARSEMKYLGKTKISV